MISAMALVNRGEVAWIEDPGFYQARRAFGFAGANVVPRPVDGEGITIARPSKQRSPKIIYVTPSHQFPLGKSAVSSAHDSLSTAVRPSIEVCSNASARISLRRCQRAGFDLICIVVGPIVLFTLGHVRDISRVIGFAATVSLLPNPASLLRAIFSAWTQFHPR